MIGFGPVEVRQLDGQWQEVVAACPVSLNGHPLCTIPAGYRSDGLSRRGWMPRRWGRFSPRYRAAALLHDYLLDEAWLTKAEIDWLFMGALRSTGVAALEAGLFWLAVRTRRPGKRFVRAA